MSTKYTPGGATNHAYPWALIRRGGGIDGARPFTRMAYLTRTVVGDDGKAVALLGFIGNENCRSWTKSERRIEWSDVVRSWRSQPTPEAIRKSKQRIPKAQVIDAADALYRAREHVGG